MAQWMVENFNEVPNQQPSISAFRSAGEGEKCPQGGAIFWNSLQRYLEWGQEVVQGQVPCWPHALGSYSPVYHGVKLFTQRGHTVALNREAS